MKIEATSQTFKYNSIVKTLYKKGKLPSVKYDFYGEKLTKKNCTIEHLECVCNGGKTTLDNVVLATANKNQERGCRPLSEVFSWANAGRYLNQFKDIVIQGFNGNDYIKGIIKTVMEILQREKIYSGVEQ